MENADRERDVMIVCLMVSRVEAVQHDGDVEEWGMLLCRIVTVDL